MFKIGQTVRIVRDRTPENEGITGVVKALYDITGSYWAFGEVGYCDLEVQFSDGEYPYVETNRYDSRCLTAI